MANTHTNMGKTHEEAEKLQNDHNKFETTAQVSENNLYVYIFWMLRVKKQLTQQVSTCKFRHACQHFMCKPC